ncbi:N-acetyltransferase, partial [Vibrio parahaemolyticus]|nr:N-acetyltransferase [Vibrio parahaemolyticus]
MHKVTHETTNSTFWVDLEQGYKAKVIYQLKGNVMHITSTVV